MNLGLQSCFDCYKRISHKHASLSKTEVVSEAGNSVRQQSTGKTVKRNQSM